MDITEGEVCPLNAENFEQVIESTPIVFVEFWATWCVPCTQFAKVYAQVAKANPNILFASVDVEQVSTLSELFEIRSVPYVMVFKEGIAIYSDAGVLPESALKELVEQAVAVDVSEIRSQLNTEQDER